MTAMYKGWFNFGDFDPTKTLTSYAPFPYEGYVIHVRSLLLLKGKSRSDIESMLNLAHERIVSFLDHAKDLDVETLKNLGREDCLQEKSDGSGWEPKPGALDELKIESATNVDRLYALLYSFDAPITLSPEAIGLGFKKYEVFAAMAIGYVFEYLNRRQYRMEVKSGQLQKAYIEQLKSEDIKRLGQLLIKGTEVVAYAERFHDEEQLEARYQQEILKLQAQLSTHSEGENGIVALDVQAEVHAQLAKMASERAKAMNIKRHQRTHEAKALVCAEWLKSPSAYGGADRSGVFFADWLLAQDPEMKFVPRVIARWIRECAKENGIKLR